MNTLFCTCDYYVLYYHMHIPLTTLGLLQTQKEKITLHSYVCI